MKKRILQFVPILMVLTVISVALYYTNLFGIQQKSALLTYGIWTLVIGYSVSIVICAGILILEKGNPSKSLAWIMMLILLPGLGLILYSFLGAHFKEESKTSKGNPEFLKLVKSYRKKRIEPAGLQELDLEEKALRETRHPAIRRLIRMMSGNPKSLFSHNNRLQMLIDGEETFDELFAALRAARHHIHMEYFIWTHDELGQKIKTLLQEKVKEGVEVRIIVDGLGSLSLKNSYIRELRDSGIEMAAFRPVRWAFLNSRSNFRNHRKIVVIDGHTGFTGGINIDGKYLKGDPNLGHWRDTHMKLEGDAVKGLQLTFLADWYFLMQKKVSGEAYFPPVKFTNQRAVHIIGSGADAEWDGIKNAYLTIINSSRKYVWLCTPYLIPGETTLNALKCAAAAGLDVRLIVPKAGDSVIVQLASQSFTEELVNYGVRVFVYQKGFIHAKVMVADDEIGTIGSANLDIRSFDQNLEINAFFYDKPLVRDLKAQFEKDFANCKEIKAEALARRSTWQHLKEGACRLLAPLL